MANSPSSESFPLVSVDGRRGGTFVVKELRGPLRIWRPPSEPSMTADGESRHRPSLWAANLQTLELVAEVGEAGIPALDVHHGGLTPATFAAKELVYAYAMWISSEGSRLKRDPSTQAPSGA